MATHILLRRTLGPVSAAGCMALLAVAACSSPPPQAAPAAPATPATVALPTPAEPKPRDYPGIHNAVAYHEGFVSGSVPDGDAGFQTLAAMGIRTIISVDGAMPDVEAAKVHGIRYIHLPIGYNGFDETRRLELTRATRDAMADGPVYIHCHHGKHRSAGAAAAIAASLGWCSAEEAVARMKVSGTAPNYRGLYACAESSQRLDPARLDAIPGSFPPVSRPSSLVKAMVEMDEVVEHLKLIEKSGWVAPQDHPDLVPVAEAGRLVDLHRVLAEGDAAARKGTEFGAGLRAGQAEAQALEDLLAAAPRGQGAGLDPAAVAAMSARFKALNTSCKECHARFRD